MYSSNLVKLYYIVRNCLEQEQNIVSQVRSYSCIFTRVYQSDTTYRAQSFFDCHSHFEIWALTMHAAGAS